MFGMAVDYFLLVVAEFFAILQIVASRNGLYRLCLFAEKNKLYNRRLQLLQATSYGSFLRGIAI
jgi:hypothetical protein